MTSKSELKRTAALDPVAAAERIYRMQDVIAKLRSENAALLDKMKAAEVILGLWSETELDPEDEEYEAWMAAYSESVAGWLTEARAVLMEEHGNG